MNIEDYTVDYFFGTLTLLYKKSPVLDMRGIDFSLSNIYLEDLGMSPIYQQFSYNDRLEYANHLVYLNSVKTSRTRKNAPSVTWHDTPEAKELKYLLALGRVTVRDRVHEVTTPVEFVSLSARYYIIDVCYRRLRKQCYCYVVSTSGADTLYVFDKHYNFSNTSPLVIDESIYDLISNRLFFG